MIMSTKEGRRVVIVTGGASGIGLGMVNYFGSKGDHVAVFDIHAEAPAGLLDELTSTHTKANFSYYQCDVSDWNSVSSAFKGLYTTCGHIDVVMGNAGISREESLIPTTIPTISEPFEPTKPNLRTMDVNMTGALYTTKLAIHYLLLNTPSPTTGSRGSIVLTASNAGIYAFPVAPLYAACKAALVNLTRSLGPALLPHHIQINALAPAVLETNIAPSKDLFQGMKMTPMSTLVMAVDGLVEDVKRTAQIVEVHGDKATVREVYGYVDEDSEFNLRRFWSLGYA
jgi:NAD(P)-dependent dehydrogenase (short-subunit alcohol dehydrogenase family)